MPLRLIFMGTPDFAVPTLVEIVGRGHEVAAVYTRAPKPAGRRGLELTPSPVEREARRFGLTVLTPASRRSAEAAETFRAHGADAAVVVAYGLILPKPILDAPPLGCFNLHASLLPRWRGAAPIQAAIAAGDGRTGVTTMRMEQGLDTGPILLREETEIGPGETAEVYISSADWMPRNFVRRVEVLFPVEDAAIRARLLTEILSLGLRDSLKARRLLPDGTYVPVDATTPAVRSQTALMEIARGTVEPPPLHDPAIRFANIRTA